MQPILDGMQADGDQQGLHWCVAKLDGREDDVHSYQQGKCKQELQWTRGEGGGGGMNEGVPHCVCLVEST